MNSSQSLKELSKALAQLQSEMPSVPLNAVNPFFNNSRYADLGSVIETSKPLLFKNGLSITQLPTTKFENGIPYVGVRTILLHVSGEWIEDTIVLPIMGETEEDQPTKNEQPVKKKKIPNYPQKAGIAITYLRRYMWVSFLGMYADEDTDGNTDKLDEIESLRAEIKTIVESNPLHVEEFKKAKTKLGYDTKSIDLKLTKEVLKKFKEIVTGE